MLLVAYASLYPLSGWRDVGLSPFAYLSAPWPRYVTVFDIVVNVVGYLPFGFLAVMALHPQVRAVGAVAAAIAGATLRVFDASGHVPHLEEPDAVAAAVLDFCAGHGGRT